MLYVFIARQYLRKILLRGKYLQWFGANYFEVNGDDCNEIGVKYSKENTVLFKELRNHPVPLKYAWNGRTPHIRTNLDYQQCTQPHSGKFVCLTSIWMVPFEIALGQCDFLTCSQYNNKNNKLKHL